MSGKRPGDHNQALDRDAFLAAQSGRRNRGEREAGLGQRATDIGCAMGVAQSRQQLHAVAGMGLDRKGEDAIRREHAPDRFHDRREIVDIDEDIGGKDEVMLRGITGRIGQKLRDVGGDEAVIEAFRRRLRDHRRGQIDADQPVHDRAKSGAAEPGAAAEIEHGAKTRRTFRGPHRPIDGLAQQRRAAISKVLGERRVVAGGVLVEQAADVCVAHRRINLAGAEAGELEPGAVVIVGIGVAGFFEGGDGAAHVTEPVADGAEREPCGGENGCQRDGLHQDLGGAGKIAARALGERPFVAPVGDQIAGGYEQRPGVGH